MVEKQQENNHVILWIFGIIGATIIVMGFLAALASLSLAMLFWLMGLMCVGVGWVFDTC